jgi:hypothetical protein
MEWMWHWHWHCLTLKIPSPLRPTQPTPPLPPRQILAKPKISTGKKIDATMDKVRLGLFFRDAEVTKENLEKAKKLIEDVSWRRPGWGGVGVVNVVNVVDGGA